METRNLLKALLASAIVSVLMTFAFLQFVNGPGGWAEMLSHPGFWVFFVQASGLLFLTGVLASALTLFMVRR